MVNRNGRRVMGLALVLCAMGTIDACAAASRTSEDMRVTYQLRVENRTDFEVVVYAMLSATGRGPRLGTARPLGKTMLKIPADLVETHNMFAVQLHAIGAPMSVPNWVSYGAVLGENMVAQLDIYGDEAGNLRMSSLTTRLARAYK